MENELRAALDAMDFAGLASVLKEASDSEQDLPSLVAPHRDGVFKVLAGGLSREDTHESAVLYLAKIAAGDRQFFDRVCGLLKAEDRAEAAGSAYVISVVCARNPGTCRAIPQWVGTELLRMLEIRHAKESLGDRGATARVRAAEALGAIGYADAIPVLVQALGESDEAVATGSRYALTQMGNGGRVVREIADALPSLSGPALSNAMWVIGRLAAGMPGEDEGLRALVPKMAGVFAGTDDVETQRRAVRAMLAIDREMCVSEIAGLLGRNFGERSERVWRAAVGGLSRLADAGYGSAETALRAYVKRMESAPEGARPDAYEEARFALDVMEAEGSA